MKNLKKIIKYSSFLLFSLFILIGCGNNETVEESGSAGQESDEMVFRLSEPLRDGTKVAWYWQENQGIIPYLLYRPLLIENTATGELEGELVDEFSISDDELTYSFVMKDNLKWSDGEALTPEDVKWSMETSLQVSVINGIYPEAFKKIVGAEDFVNGETEKISGIEIADSNINITLAEPVGNFANVLSQFVIFPEHLLAEEDPLELHNSEFWSAPVTSGMYQVHEFNANNYYELTKNTNYEGTEPKIDRVIVTYLTDSVMAMENRESYLYTTNILEEIAQLDNMGELEIHEIEMLFYRYFIVNLAGYGGEGDAVLTDRDVREALMYAIDRESLVGSVLQGTATVLNSGVPSAQEEYNEDINEYEYNPEKAIEMLEEADFDFSSPLKIKYYYDDQSSIDFMQAISHQLSEIGIDVELAQIDGDATTALFQTRDYDLALKGLSSFGYESWYGEYSTNNTNFNNIYNDEHTVYSDLIHDLTITADTDDRYEILQNLQVVEQENLLKLPLFTMQNYVYVNEEVVDIPEDFEFGNPWYIHDYRFEEWEVQN